ncbi:ABC transporter permease [Propionibacterium freudenreichii]|uniref:ABC transporter permease n=2 Tax=Propionibacterium freudenreichii TaxID=1744 RepID=UPI0018C72F1D|nr:ABC transporter permease [Propionibacterium freudenreichii]
MLQMKIIMTSKLQFMLQLIWPIFFATTALLVYRQSNDPSALLYAALGSAAMGTWSSVATTATGALQRERRHGTLELLVGTPTPFALVMVPITTAMATMGAYSLIATLLWGRLVFRVRVVIDSPVAFALTFIVMVLSVALLGFLLSIVTVRYRTAWVLGNLLEYPGWLLCGFVVPLAFLPRWADQLSWILTPKWGMAALRAAASGEPWIGSLLGCLVLGLAYAALGGVLARIVLQSARTHASISLT